eukprot:Seg75.4 transcript_id=Seg75.4/GoldUCD/mRNA.D3Y31 product="Biogenesis of lysosome-related organelles complex 1 subunit 4" protein_id=Seg75.4/GoldUCD/D3Y31
MKITSSFTIFSNRRHKKTSYWPQSDYQPRFKTSQDLKMADIERSVEEAAATDLNKSADTESQTSENELEFNVDNVVADFSRLFAVDPTSQLQSLETLVDSLLAHSGECCSITDQIRGESKKLLFASMPEFYEKRAEMQKIFRQIDELEEFIAAIKTNVDVMDEKVQTAERQLGNKNLKKVISSIPIPKFFAQKKQVQSYLKQEVTESDREIPDVFKVDDYLVSELDASENTKDSFREERAT